MCVCVCAYVFCVGKGSVGKRLWEGMFFKCTQKKRCSGVRWATFDLPDVLFQSVFCRRPRMVDDPDILRDKSSDVRLSQREDEGGRVDGRTEGRTTITRGENSHRLRLQAIFCTAHELKAFPFNILESKAVGQVEILLVNLGVDDRAE